MSDAFDKSVDMIARCNAEIKSLRKGNRDLQLHFDVLKADYDRLRHEVGRLQALISDAKEAIDADDAIAAYRILDRQPAPSGWRPIETAPKTRDDNRFGPLIVLASTSGHRAIGYWGERCGRWGWVNPNDHQIMDYWNAFTHWMPLPPPAPGKEEA